MHWTSKSFLPVQISPCNFLPLALSLFGPYDKIYRTLSAQPKYSMRTLFYGRIRMDIDSSKDLTKTSIIIFSIQIRSSSIDTISACHWLKFVLVLYLRTLRNTLSIIQLHENRPEIAASSVRWKQD